MVGVSSGEWVIRLHGNFIRDGEFHAWIERDDSRRLGVEGSQQYWPFPSFFAEESNVDSHSVSSLACGHRVVGFANFDEKAIKPNISSSQGPTRDGREKPEILAPGADIIASNGFGLDDERWISMTGTSMASPYVAGVAGLMLGVEPRLTAGYIPS